MLIDVLRGRAAADRLRRVLASGPVPFICAINIEELWRGSRPDEERAIAALIRGLRVVPLGADEAERAGRWRRDYAARGITLSQGDCLIAAAALGVGASLATANVADFPMRELVVEEWPGA